MDAVAKSITEFGMNVPIVIDKDGVIVAGHTRYKACKQLHLSTVPCVVVDNLTKAQVRAYRLADNKVAELAEWDFGLLTDELADLTALFDMADFGFTFEDAPEPPDFQPVGASEQPRLDTFEPRPVTCPHCGGAFDARPQL